MSTCGKVSKLTKLEEVRVALKSLTDFLQPALPFVNSHLNSFFTDLYWDTHLPQNLQKGLSAVSVSDLKTYFKSLSLIKRQSNRTNWSTVIESNVTFTRSSLEDIVNRIGQLFLCSMNLSCDVVQFNIPLSIELEVAHSEDISAHCVLEHCTTAGNSSDTGWSSYRFDRFMSEKKMHEVEIMSEFVVKVTNFQNASFAENKSVSRDESQLHCCPLALQNRLCGIEYLIDVGSGKGYLSSFLMLLYNYRVLAIDSSSVNTYGCTKRTATLQKAWSSFIRQAQERQTQNRQSVRRGKHWKSKIGENKQNFTNCDRIVDNTMGKDSSLRATVRNEMLAGGYSKSVTDSKNDAVEACERLKNVTLYVEENLNTSQLLRDNFCDLCIDVDDCFSYGLVGLHTCGQLGVDSIKLFCNSTRAKFLVNVPCCYHLLNERHEGDKTGVTGDNTSGETSGFPLSRNLQAIEFCIGRNARMMSAQSVHRMSSEENNLELSRPLLFRALLSVIIKQKLGHTALEHHVGRIGGKFSNFHQYMRKALAKLHLENLEVSDDEIGEVYGAYEELSEKFHKYFLLRALFAPLIEGCILLDRLAYLLEQESVREAFIVELFDPFLSPRCHAVVALR